MDYLLTSILEDGTFSFSSVAASTACSLFIGFLIAFFYKLKNDYTESFITTLMLLPVVVQLVIMLVNGEVGTGIAVAGAFSLIRFRSAPGTGQEITSIFLAMAAGLATGMGYLGIALSFTVLILIVNFAILQTGFGNNYSKDRVLKITIPENLDFEGKFDDVFEKYTRKADLCDVKTSEMGSVYKLTYKIRLRDNSKLKPFMDSIREKNGNLEVAVTRAIKREDTMI